MTETRFIDLHVHSSYSSDGEVPPAALARLAADAGLAAVALTDHDEVGGVPAFLAAALDAGVEAIAGVELTCDLGERWVHILGYFIDWEAVSLRSVLASLAEARRRQTEGRLARLRALGIIVDDEKLAAAARGQPPVGPIIGTVVLNDPANDDHPLLAQLRRLPKAAMPYFHFDRDMLSHGKPAYFPVPRISPCEAIDAVTAAGGVAVFAHPGDRFRLPGDEGIFADLAAAGLAGLEAYCSYHDAAQEAAFAVFARSLGLVATAGSDFHGATVKPHVKLSGISYHPYGILDELRERRGAVVK